MAGLKDIYRGDTKVYNLTFTRNGAVFDLTGSVVWFTMKKKEDAKDEDAKIQKKITSHVDPVNGKTAVTLTAKDTDLLVGKYYYDFQLVDSIGQVTTLTKGTVSILQDITRTRV